MSSFYHKIEDDTPYPWKNLGALNKSEVEIFEKENSDDDDSEYEDALEPFISSIGVDVKIHHVYRI